MNYPPLMRGIPRLEVGVSAPWSFSFPAYEESSLQDDCNHPNLTISTGDPRRPVRFIHNGGLSFLCVRMSCCARHPFRLIQDILCCRIFFAACSSRSMACPHTGQRYVRSDSFNSLWICPQAMQVLLDGNHRSTLTRSFPFRSAL